MVSGSDVNIPVITLVNNNFNPIACLLDYYYLIMYYKTIMNTVRI